MTDRSDQSDRQLDRLRETLRGFGEGPAGDDARRKFMQELMMQTHVDLQALQAVVTELGTQQQTVHKALFDGDDEGTPGIVPLARRASAWLDGACRVWKWALGLIGSGAIAAVIALYQVFFAPGASQATQPVDRPPVVDKK